MSIDPVLLEDFLNLFAGALLGEGCSRKVFAHQRDPSLVIKVEEGSTNHNVGEWDAWCAWGSEKPGLWLAPCVALSPRGRVLLQRRVKPVTVEELPEMVPQFLTDLKASNFGLYEGRVVCCDYGTLVTQLPQRLKKAHWND
jgi:hypothetical protein